MLNRAFSKREKVVLLILSVILLSLIYYRFVYINVNRRIAGADTTAIEDMILSEQQKAQSIENMQAEMEKAQSEGNGLVSTYDNFKAEANALNAIFAQADSFNFSFDRPVADGDAVRRVISIVFSASDYVVARNILQQIHDCPYRTLISDISINAVRQSKNDVNYAEDPSIYTDAVQGSLKVTFYETLYDAKTVAGLELPKEAKASKRVGLANADVSMIERSDLETLAESIASDRGYDITTE